MLGTISCVFWFEGAIHREFIRNKGLYFLLYILNCLHSLDFVYKTSMTIHLFIFCKKKQIASERWVECVFQNQGKWLYVETSINMKLGNMSDILYDECNKKLDNPHNLNTKHKKQIYKQISCTHAWKMWEKCIN